MNTADITSTIFILWVFATLHSFTMLVKNLDKVKKNWAHYRCKPSVMPFANILGPPPDNNTMKNFTYCIKNISKIVAGSSLDSISSGMGSASSSLDSAGTGFDTIATAVGNTKGNYKKNSGSMFSVLGNVSMQVKRFFNTSKDLSSKASFGSTTTSNLTNTAVDSGKGGFDKVMHAISSVP